MIIKAILFTPIGTLGTLYAIHSGMKMNAIKMGDVVRYARPVEDERSLRFVVVQQPDDRGKVTIKLIDDTYRIAPIETIATEEIVLA